MAKYVLKFIDCWFNNNTARIDKTSMDGKDFIEICFYDKDDDHFHSFNMDKSTAIKFAKTLRTEINKI
tara:strand:+ start:1088 stop:1291 length:204 start_codon:yes stop_codon:yes gene_type:complete